MSDYSNTVALVVFFVAVIIYFLPALIASTRTHPNSSSIMLLNVFLGWTLIGWVVSLAWSASSVAKQPSDSSDQVIDPDRYAKLERISLLKEKGVLTDPEFQAEKAKILEG